MIPLNMETSFSKALTSQIKQTQKRLYFQYAGAVVQLYQLNQSLLLIKLFEVNNCLFMQNNSKNPVLNRHPCTVKAYFTEKKKKHKFFHPL